MHLMSLLPMSASSQRTVPTVLFPNDIQQPTTSVAGFPLTLPSNSPCKRKLLIPQTPNTPIPHRSSSGTRKPLIVVREPLPKTCIIHILLISRTSSESPLVHPLKKIQIITTHTSTQCTTPRASSIDTDRLQNYRQTPNSIHTTQSTWFPHNRSPPISGVHLRQRPRHFYRPFPAKIALSTSPPSAMADYQSDIPTLA
jgi:hypothetical protein